MLEEMKGAGRGNAEVGREVEGIGRGNEEVRREVEGVGRGTEEVEREVESVGRRGFLGRDGWEQDIIKLAH